MKKLFVFLTVFLLLNINTYALEKIEVTTINADTKTPVIWDFGKVNPGQILNHEFNFINTSGKPLKIKEVLTSCGCTLLEVKKKDLLPGESTIISIKFDSKGYHGAVEQFVYINTDNLDNSVIKLIIRARVEK